MAFEEFAEYVPALPPENPEDLPAWAEAEFWKIAGVIAVLSQGHLPKTHVAPDKVYDGMTRYADGTDWDPGSGEGAYIYYASAWHKLG